MPDHASQPSRLLLMAEITGVHGVRGAVKLRAYGDDPEALPEYQLQTEAKDGRKIVFRRVWNHSGNWLAEVEGVTDRTVAEGLRGTKLYMDRDELPEIEEDGTYYHADLVGLSAVKPDGDVLGTIIAVANFGAGDLIEIKPAKGNSFYIPFTDEAVPEVDIAGGVVTVAPPPGLLD